MTVGTTPSSSFTSVQATPLMRLESVGYQIDERGSTGHSSLSMSANKSSPLRLRRASSATTSIQGTEHIQVLLNNIDLVVMPYEKISVIGPNGAGKSTLMKLMLGLLTPTSGHISCHPELQIGYVPQKFSVPPILPLTVKDLLNQPKKRLNREQQSLLYHNLSVTPLLHKQVIHLSGGESQRVLLARSLLSKPNLLILDEPMQGLDPESERWLYQFIDDLPDFLQCAMVVVSHDLHWVMRGSRRVICLNKHICCEGQPSELGVSQEFKTLFGHQYEQPYIHKPHDCQHLDPDA